MYRNNLHRLSADGQKSGWQLVYANAVRQQFEHFGDNITCITGLRNNALLNAYIA